MPRRLIYALLVDSRVTERMALLLAKSIRTWAGRLRNQPIWVLTPHAYTLADQAKGGLAALDVQMLSFDVDEGVAGFPFATKVLAAAAAEAAAEGKTHILVWMDADTLVLREPSVLVLPKDKTLACCPVHHRLIGAGWDEDLPVFWGLVYAYCRVRDASVFPVWTVVGNEKIRAYFNAGLLAVRPEKGLLRAWRDNFLRHYRRQLFEIIYKQDEQCRVFMHQAMLAGTVLSTLAEPEIEILDPSWNYPLHVHTQVFAGNRARSLSELVTCRYEDIELLMHGDWQRSCLVEEPLKSWLQETEAWMKLPMDSSIQT